jgi:hypothetical protein
VCWLRYVVPGPLLGRKRPEADARRVSKADIRVDLGSLRCQYYWPCYTDSPQKRTLIYQ